MDRDQQWYIIEMRGVYVARIFTTIKFLRKKFGKICVVGNVVSVYA